MSGSRKGRLRWTGPGRPPAPPERVRPGLAGQRAPVGGHPRPLLGQPGLAEPAHRAAVQLDLVDRLVGAGAGELGRPVGGQHQQRDRRLVGLDHGRVEVGRRRPGGAQHRHRPPAGLGQAEGGERRGPLVDPDVQPQPAALLQLDQGHGQRGAARSGRQDGLAQPAPGQLVAEGQAERGRRVHERGLPASESQDAAAGLTSPRNWAAAAARSRHGAGSASKRASWSGSTVGPPDRQLALVGRPAGRR